MKIEEQYISELIQLLEEQTYILFNTLEAQQAGLSIVRYVLIKEIQSAQQTINKEVKNESNK